MIVGTRVEFLTDHYLRLRVRDPKAGHDRYLYLHRPTPMLTRINPAPTREHCRERLERDGFRV